MLTWGTTIPAIPWLVVVVGAAGCVGSHGMDGGIETDARVRDAGFPERDAAAPDATLDAAVDGGVLTHVCASGTALPCDCAGGAIGFRYCEERAWLDRCDCPPAPADAGVDAGPSEDGGPDEDGGLADGGEPDGGGVDAGPPDAGPPCEVPDDEWCDGTDNDCDGVVDEGFVCPDGAIRHTLPWTGRVMAYDPTLSGPRTVQPMWPSEAGEFIDLPDDALGPIFRRSDGRLFYGDVRVFEFLDDRSDVELPTPPCDFVWDFAFEADDTLVYTCQDRRLRRGNGVRLADVELDSDDRLIDVLDSGDLLLSDEDRVPGGVPVIVFSRRDGTRTAPVFSRWSGNVRGRLHGIVVVGDSAFVTVYRTYRAWTRHEAVILRVDAPDGEWRVVRRVPLPPRMNEFQFLGLPDGTLLESRVYGESPRERHVFAFPPGEPMRHIYREPAGVNTEPFRFIQAP